MIREIIYLGRRHIVDYVWHIPTPPLIMLEYYAAINIHNPGTEPESYPPWVKPILRLDFNDIRTEPEWESEKKRVKMMIDLDAEKSVVFLDFIDRSDKKFTVFINDEHGTSISAAYAKFIKAVNPKVAVRGLAISDTHFANPLVMQKLQKQWSIKVKEDSEKRKNHV